MKGKKHLSSGKWLVMLLVTALLLVMVVPIFNFITDPYGAFGDPVLEWWSYDMTMNPRVAKHNYLEKYHDNYDSSIIGASGSSILSVEALNSYLDASFYNTFFYYSNAQGFREIAEYLLDHYTVKNLVLNLSITAAANNPETDDILTKAQHWQVDGSSPLGFYARYLFASPLQGIQKLNYRKSDGYMPHGYKTITPETGEYDRRARDTENIRDLENYLSRDAYAVFRDYAVHYYTLPHLEECAEALAAIKARCEEKGVRLIVVCQPMYHENLSYYSWADRSVFFNRIAEVTDYWDFTLTPLSYDPRYFYDMSHARNPVGRLMLARIFGDESVWLPEHFGRYVTQGSNPGAPEPIATQEADYSVRLPILRYGELVEAEPGEGQISVSAFTQQMQALAEAGYTPIDIWQMRDYVENGAVLPEKPVLITLDGGYESQYALAWPILRDLGFKAACFVSGSNLRGDADSSTASYFSAEQAEALAGSGLITLASLGGDPQLNLRKDGETEAAYVEALTRDALAMRELLGESAGFYCYPDNRVDSLCLLALRETGTFASVAGSAPCTTIIRGLPQSLLNMPRLFVSEALSGSELIKLLEEETNN